MVHDRIAAGETTVVSTAAVLRSGKQMEKLPHYNFSWTVSKKNMLDSSSGDKLKFGDLSFEETRDLSRDRQLLELEVCALEPLIKTFSNARSEETKHNCCFIGWQFT
jgi:hypothetical protein